MRQKTETEERKMKEMRNSYEAPELEIMRLDSADVISTSGIIPEPKPNLNHPKSTWDLPEIKW